MRRLPCLIILLTAPVASAQAIPSVSVQVRSGMALYRSTACGCFDRYTWGVEGGLAAQWHRFFALEAEAWWGGVVLHGHYLQRGAALGLRSALAPGPERGWDGPYVRAGLTVVGISHTYTGPSLGVYAATGWSLPIVSKRLMFEPELSSLYVFGDMARLNLGAQGGLRATF